MKHIKLKHINKEISMTKHLNYQTYPLQNQSMKNISMTNISMTNHNKDKTYKLQNI